GPLILCDHPLHLNEEAVLGAVTDRALDEVDVHPVLGQFLDQHVLVHVAACQAIRAVDEHDIEQPIRGGVAQRIEPGPVEPRAADALIDVAVLGRHRDAQGVRRLLERGHLGGHGLLRFLPRRGYAGVECSPLRHTRSPSARAGAACCIPPLPICSGGWPCARSTSSRMAWPSRSNPSACGRPRHSILHVRSRRITTAPPHGGGVTSFSRACQALRPARTIRSPRDLEDAALQDEAQKRLPGCVYSASTPNVCRISSGHDHFRAAGGGGSSTLTVVAGSRLAAGIDDAGSPWPPPIIRPGSRCDVPLTSSP